MHLIYMLLYWFVSERFIYTKYWEILTVEHCGKIYLHKILRNTLCWTLGIFICTKYWEILYVEYCGKIYLLKIMGNTLLTTVGRFIYTKYCDILPVFCVNKSFRNKSVQQHIYQVHIKIKVEIYLRTVLFYLTKRLYIYFFLNTVTKIRYTQKVLCIPYISHYLILKYMYEQNCFPFILKKNWLFGGTQIQGIKI
jgi:hypothetical protein